MYNFKAIFAIATLASMTAVPMSEARINTRNLSCTNAKNLVQDRGIIVLSTGRNTYDRYVANQSYCDTGDVGVRRYVPTGDSNSCFIGYTCEPYEGGRSKGKGYLRR